MKLIILSLVFYQVLAQVDEIEQGIRDLEEEAANYQEAQLVFNENNYELVEDDNYYDFIIVGGGTTGAVVAGRLAEENWKVLLLEAGEDETPITKIPAMTRTTIQTGRSWSFMTEPSNDHCLGFKNNTCGIITGKILGGSSSVSSMHYKRGHPQDYKNWGQISPGWSYEDLEPVFEKIERANLEKEVNCLGTQGKVHIENHRYDRFNMSRYFEAGKSLGLQELNSCNYNGIGYVKVHAFKGSRFSTNSAYLSSKKSNLVIIKKAYVVKILLDEANSKAEGVQFVLDDKLISVKAAKEIVISAGNVNTAQLLLLSGIGPKESLEKAGIKSLVELPVGEQVRTQIKLHLIFLHKKIDLPPVPSLRDQIHQYLSEGRGPLTDPRDGDDSIAFINTQDPGSQSLQPEFFILGTFNELYWNIKSDIYQAVFKPIVDQVDRSYFTSAVVLPYAKSPGSISLYNSDPFNKPKLDLNILSDQEDLDLIIKAVNFTKNLLKAPPLKHLEATLQPYKIPACLQSSENDSEYWACFAKHFAYPLNNIFGATRMGPVGEAVVDELLKVHKVSGLRIAGNSVLPVPLGGDGTATAIAIGEKAADLIKKQWII